MGPRMILLGIWLGGALLATAGGLLAVHRVADQVGEPNVPVLDQNAVDAALATPPPRATSSTRPSTTPVTHGTPTSRATVTATRAPSPRATAAPSPTRTASVVRAFSSAGGSVGARCRASLPEQVYATPAQGYRLDESGVEHGVLEVRFSNDSTRVQLTIGCRNGSPVLLETKTEDDGGEH